jgi:integrase
MTDTSTNNVEQLTSLLTSRPDVERLLDRLYVRLSPGSVQLVVRTLLDLGEWGTATGLLTEPVALSMKDAPAGNPQRPVETYTPSEVATLVAAAKGVSLRYWAFLYTIAETGRRASEVLGLQWSWLRLEAEPKHFHLPYNKSQRQQYVPLSARLMSEVFTPSTMAFLASHDDGGHYQGDPAVRPFPWHYQSVYLMTKRLSRVAGVRPLGLHAFRHTAATAWLQRGVPLAAVSALLGHNNVGTTDRRYSHVSTLDFAHYLDD